MSPFSMENPLQSIYFKKKGVERLLKRNKGSTVSAEFINGTRKEIERDKKTPTSVRTENDENDIEKTMRIPSVNENENETESNEHRQEKEEKANEEKRVTELSCISPSPSSFSMPSSSPSSLSMDWSLPGMEEETDPKFSQDVDEERERIRLRKIKKNHIDIRKVYNNISMEQRDPQSSKHGSTESIDTFELVLKLVTCHEDHVSFKDWIRCF
mmetsp:Transcript_36499/g.41040  ORF Transcript_36499/g.41040 Transcript_36499/m.41040 type:complete len:213 (+) Transcript_36499:405-1043(+)